MINGSSDCFTVDTISSIYPSDPSHPYLYDRVPGITLGGKEDESSPSAQQELRPCFNCGSPNHTVTSCPEPINRQLVSLSRQLFNFLHSDLHGQETARFYIVQSWRQQRLEWLRSYEPGMIRGPPLRDALGLQEGDPGNMVEWLRNMAYWGYPPGWVHSRDPRHSVRSRILDDEAEEQSIAPESFTIFDDRQDDEEIDLRLFSRGVFSTRIRSPTSSSSTTSIDVGLTRWATYPNTFFPSTTLSIYNGTPLGGVSSSPSRVSVTFTPERSALWEHILSGHFGTNSTSPVPPWRLPGAFGASTVGDDFIPPPPSTTPPPLPATPNSPLATINSQKRSVLSRASPPPSSSEKSDVTDDRLVDMDVSDDSE